MCGGSDDCNFFSVVYAWVDQNIPRIIKVSPGKFQNKRENYTLQCTLSHVRIFRH